jgi:hypothetical protein
MTRAIMGWKVLYTSYHEAFIFQLGLYVNMKTCYIEPINYLLNFRA